MTKLNIKAFGLASGVLWGLGVLILGLLATYFNYANSIVDILATVYIGYKSTLLGSFIGLVWGFVDTGIGGIIFAWLYNKFSN